MVYLPTKLGDLRWANDKHSIHGAYGIIIIGKLVTTSVALPSRKFKYYSISNGGLIKLWKISIFNR